MRILVLTNLYPPHHYGGYELQCQDVVDRWRRDGHDVLVLTSTWRVPHRADPPSERGHVRRVLGFWWADHRILNPSLRARLRLERQSQRALRTALVEHRPDVVSAWAMGCLSLGLLTSVRSEGLPVVQVVCDDWLVYGPTVDAWARPFARRPALGRLVAALTGLPTRLEGLGSAGPTCFVSEFTRRRALEQSAHPPEDSAVVPSGIDATTFPVDLDAPLEPRPWQWRMLAVGRLDARKGLDVAVRALVELPEARLEVIGHGDEHELAELRDLAAALDVAERVHFDEVPRAALPERYRDADVFLFPVRWEEPFGLVPLEAMACDTPVVATATGGSADFLRDGVTCLRIPVDDPGALAAAVRSLAGDVELRTRLVAAGRRAAHELTVERCAETLLAWHAAAAGQAPRPDPAPSAAELAS